MSNKIVTKEQQAAQGLGRTQRPIGYVPATPERRTPIAYPISNEYPIASPESHLAALESLRETATPVDRAIGLGIRLLPYTIAWIVLAAVLAFILNGNVIWPFVLFALLTAGSYYMMDRTEYQFSAGGIERHKADLAAELRAKELANTHELKRAALGSFIEQLRQK